MRQHPDEMVADAVLEQFLLDVDQMVNFMLTDGRPIFETPLTDAEMLRRFFTPELRAEIEQHLLDSEGPKAVADYRQRMMELNERYFERVALTTAKGTGV